MLSKKSFPVFLLALLQVASGKSEAERVCESAEVANCLVRGMADFLERLEAPSTRLKQLSTPHQELCSLDHVSACRRQHRTRGCVDVNALESLERAISSGLRVLCEKDGSLLRNIVENLSCWKGHGFFECLKNRRVTSMGDGFFTDPLDACSARRTLAQVFKACAAGDSGRQQRCQHMPDRRALERLENAFAEDPQCFARGAGVRLRAGALLSLCASFILLLW